MHRQGLTVALRRVLLSLYDEINPQNISRDEVRRDDLILRCRSALAVATCECDLSEYDKCLTTLDSIRPTILSLEANQATARLRRRMNTLRGISLGCLGRLEECIRAYLSVVIDALDDRGLDASAVEALGYAAMVTSYIDMPRALALGERSLTFASALSDELVVARNRCSLAQTLLYAGRADDAVDLLTAAESYCRGTHGGGGDRRELGRVLIPKALAVMSTHDGGPALMVAEEALTINSEVGDRRRYSRSTIVIALATLSAGDKRRGRELLSEALDQLYASQDWLNLVLGAFTYAYLEGMDNAEEIVRVATTTTDSRRSWVYVREAVSRSDVMPVLKRFWADHYVPFLRSAGI
jgi:hypothetical protein